MSNDLYQLRAALEEASRCEGVELTMKWLNERMAALVKNLGDGWKWNKFSEKYHNGKGGFERYEEVRRRLINHKESVEIDISIPLYAYHSRGGGFRPSFQPIYPSKYDEIKVGEERRYIATRDLCFEVTLSPKLDEKKFISEFKGRVLYRYKKNYNTLLERYANAMREATTVSSVSCIINDYMKNIPDRLFKKSKRQFGGRWHGLGMLSEMSVENDGKISMDISCETVEEARAIIDLAARFAQEKKERKLQRRAA